MVVGLGKQKGAESVHSDGLGNMARNLPANAKVVVENSNILFAIPCVENAYDETALIEAIPTEKIFEREPELLKIAFSNMPSILVKEADVLVVNEIGKNFSGTGVDPNISGTWSTEFGKGGLQVKRTCFLDLRDSSHGNANGMGLADVITKRIFDKLDLDVIYTNCFTSTVLRSGMMPPVVYDDKEAIQACIRTANQIDRPVTHIFALAVNRQRLVCQGIGDHQRNQLFREVIRAVVVGASGNRYRETISSVISQYQQICTCFRRGVGAAGVDGGLFGKEQVRSVQRQIAVDFVGRNLVITLDAIFPASVHHNRCAEDIGLEEDLRVFDRAVYVRFSCKVDNDVGLFFLEELVHALTVADVQLDKSEVRIVHHRFQCGQIASIGQLVQTNNAVVWVCFQHMKNEIGADKAGAASYDNGHDRYSLE